MVFPMKSEDKKRKAKEEVDAVTAKKKLIVGNLKLLTVLDPSGMGAEGQTVIKAVEVMKISQIVAGPKIIGIEARIVNKSCIRTFATGKLFSLDLADASGSIRLNVYDAREDFEELHSELMINGIVHFENFKSGLKNIAYNKTAHQCELTWTDKTQWKHIEDDNTTWPCIKFNFVAILTAKNLDPGSTVDVIAVVGEIGEIEEVANGPLRRVTLVDQALGRLEVTFWKSAATEMKFAEGDVLAIKNGVTRSNTFRGHTQISLGLTLETLVWADPNVAEAGPITAWKNSMIAAHN